MARPDWMTGLEVRDADRMVTMNIRNHDVEDAVALRGDQCVAARCALRALDAAHVWFYRSKAYVAWDDDGPILRYQNSKALIENVIKVLDDPDRPNSEIKTGLYDLLPPPPAQRLGVDRRRKPNAKPRKPNGETASHRVTGRISATRHA